MGAQLLDAVIGALRERSPHTGATVERVTVGDRLVIVEVADGAAGTAAGVAHRPPGDLGAEPAGQRAFDVAGWAAGADGLARRAVGMATINALSAPVMPWRTGDPFETLTEGASVIATVGLFGPAFRKFGPADVRVVERRDVEPPPGPDGGSITCFDPGAAEAAFEGADVVFVTGSTLIYGGTERYLGAAADVPEVVLVGATSSFLPRPAFDAGATMLAGVRVTDADAVRGRVTAGQCATDIHGAGLEKVSVRAEDVASGTAIG